MALIQQKTASLLLSQMGKQPAKISLFDATQWDSPGAVKGTFRVLLNNEWVRAGRQKYTFLDFSGIGGLIARLLFGKSFPIPSPQPSIRWKDRVRIPGELGSLTGYVMAPPHTGPDGRWWCWVLTSEGPQLASCDETTPVGTP